MGSFTGNQPNRYASPPVNTVTATSMPAVLAANVHLLISASVKKTKRSAVMHTEDSRYCPRVFKGMPSAPSANMVEISRASSPATTQMAESATILMPKTMKTCSTYANKCFLSSITAPFH